MGHYASEMDPDFGKPSSGEQRIQSLEDPEVRDLARSLYRGYDSGSYLGGLNSDTAVSTAEAIDNLIKLRIQESTKQDSF